MGLLIPITQDVVIPRAQYPAYTVRYEEKPDRKTQESFIYIYFQIAEPANLKGEEVWVRAPKKISPRSRLSGYIAQIGITINDQMGKNFDMDWILNKPVILTIKPNTGANGQVYNNVESIVPYAAPAPGTSLATPAPTAPAPTAPPSMPSLPPMPMMAPPVAPPAATSAMPPAPTFPAAPAWPPAPATPGAPGQSKVSF